MKGNKYNRMLKANALLENRFLINRRILNEYDVKELENKKQQIVSKLQNLKSKQSGVFAGMIKGKIDQYINDLNSVNVNDACQGTNLKSDLQTKLNDAKDGLKQKSMLNDPDNLIPTLETDISFIENFCKTQTKEPTQVSQQPEKKLDGVPEKTLDSTPQKTLDNTPQKTNNLDGFKNMKFMDALDMLNSGENFSKDDIVNYVKSKVTVRTA